MRRRRTILIVLLVALIVVVGVPYIPFGHDKRELLPRDPERATSPGIYFLDDERFVEIRSSSGSLTYNEGTEEMLGDSGDAIQTAITYSSEVEGITLSNGLGSTTTPNTAP
jgi:hypothetical protein